MDDKYFAKKIEAKWQQKWIESGAFNAEMCDERPKFYQLEMLPYPSGNLHMGHVRNYSAGDALAWYKRLKGFNVLHPIGWDSFGQPAEDAAVKRKVNPREWTEENISVMQGQLQRLGISYDWRRQMFAHRPEYYKSDERPGIAEVIIAKHRNGPTGMIELKFRRDHTRFYNLETRRPEPGTE